MTVIVEAAAGGYKSFLQAKWVFFALLVYIFPSFAREATFP